MASEPRMSAPTLSSRSDSFTANSLANERSTAAVVLQERVTEPREHEVEHEHRERRADDGASGRRADALRAAARAQAAVRGHDRDGRAVRHALDEAEDDVARLHLVEVE